jgi:hypothetical protein
MPTNQNHLAETKGKAPPMRKGLSNHEIVTLVVYLLGGDTQRVDTEDIAVKANELAPGRFTWRKYRDQINIDTVRKRLWDAVTPAKGEYLSGSEKQGWILTAAGLNFATQNIASVGSADLSKERLGLKEKQWLRSERLRMLCSAAFVKAQCAEIDAVTLQEAEEFFRIDAYVTGQAREQKITRAMTAFGDDKELGEAVKMLARKVRAGGKQ